MRIERVAGWADKTAYSFLFLTVISSPISISIFTINSSVFMGFALLAFFLSGRRINYRQPWFLLILIYFFMNAFSLTQSSSLSHSLRGLFRVLRCVLLTFSVVYVVRDEKRLKVLFATLLITAFSVGVDALIQGVTGYEWLRHRPTTPYAINAPRWTGPFPHANDFGGYLSFALPLFFGTCLGRWKYLSRAQKIFCSTGLALLGLCLMETYSRGAWVAVFIATGTLIVYLRGTRAALLFGLVVVAFLFIATPKIVRDRALSLVDTKNNTILERKELWGEAGRMISSKPFLGHGVNTYALNEPLFKSGHYFDNQYAHNGYLQMAAEIGLLGLASFLAVGLFFLVIAAAVFYPFRDLFIGTVGASFVFTVLSLLLHSATDTDLHSVLLVNILWLGMGLGWATVALSDERKKLFCP